MDRARTILVGAAVGIAVLSPANAFGWGTPEHIVFGHQIAQPFEDQLGQSLPVMTCTGRKTEHCVLEKGPTSFGDWVSAPDFARSLTLFLEAEASSGPVGCSVSWEGLEENPDAGSFFDFVDCLSAASMNNNHFGDFAAAQYDYFHKQALVAAQRYRRTRSDACREAAYTLEGWGQHYLTDSTAAGHAWNPPGSYKFASGTIFSTGLGTRMRIHDHLNERGAVMVGRGEDFVFDVDEAEFSEGRVLSEELWWGDDSQEHTATGLMVPTVPGNVQRNFTMRLSRIGLGQVTSAVECGGNGFRSVFDTPDSAEDPRRVYASDGSMCRAIINHEVWDDGPGDDGSHFFPEDVDLRRINNLQTRDVLLECARGDGKMQRGAAGYHLASLFFADRNTSVGEHEEEQLGEISIDPESVVTLEQLDCFDDPPTGDAPTMIDACGNSLCDVPADGLGSCPDGFVYSGGCCHGGRRHGSGKVEATAFVSVAVAERDLGGIGAVPGEAGEFLWFATPTGAGADGKFRALTDHGEQVLAAPGGAAVGCGRMGRYQSWEARIRGDLKAKSVMLTVLEQDDGLKIQVDDHVVTYLDQHSLTGATKVELFSAASPVPPDGFHTVRVTTLDSCDAALPTRLKLTLETGNDKADGSTGDREDGGGCAATGTGASGLVWFIVGFVLIATGRRRRSVSRRG